MPVVKLPPEELARRIGIVERLGSISAAAKEIGITRNTMRKTIKRAGRPDLLGGTSIPKQDFEIEPPPDETAPVEDIIARREKEYQRRDGAETARKLIPVRINLDGPIGLAHFGDPHVDDPGSDIIHLQRDVRLVKETEGMFAANVGDLQNNWIGRLARLWGSQSTNEREAWALTEWLVTSLDWLFIVAGNHDLWSGAGDPVKWMIGNAPGIYEEHGVRAELNFPNRKKVRINCRHDFRGHSMWNPAHGPAKAVQMGWRDHVVTAGHKHVSGYNVLKDPASGLISHVIRVAGYKKHDSFGKELGLPDQNIFPTATTIIDPQYDDDDPRLVTTIFDVEEAASYLTWKRNRT